MTNLLVHNITKRQIHAFLAKPSHAVLLTGPAGSGKFTLAKHLAEEMLGLKPDKLLSYPYVKIVQPIDAKAIGIEQVRDLDHFLSLKVPSKLGISRLVVIEDAQKMTTEAQNAILKTLEEPPTDTLIILTVSYPQALLPTIRSRMQTIDVKLPAKNESKEYFAAKGFDEKAVESALLMSGGLPGLMQALLSDEAHPLLEATETARNILNQSAYERMLMVDSLAKQKELALNTLYILGQMAHVSLQTASGKASRRWQRVLRASYSAREALLQSGQPRLVLSKLMLEL